MSLRDAAESEALLAEAEYERIEDLAAALWPKRDELQDVLEELGHPPDSITGPSTRDDPPTLSSEETPMVEGTKTLEVNERELFELRQGIKAREHELELAHEYMNNKGLSTEAADERLRILRGNGPDQPGLMHRLGFVESQIKAPPEAGDDPDQLELEANGEGDGGDE